MIELRLIPCKDRMARAAFRRESGANMIRICSLLEFLRVAGNTSSGQTFKLACVVTGCTCDAGMRPR